MDYFKMFFPDMALFDEIRDSLPISINESNYIESFQDRNELNKHRGFLQYLFNSLFEKNYKVELMTGKLLFENYIIPKLNEGAKCKEIQDALSILVGAKYILNYENDNSNDSPFQHIFNFRGIIKSLNKIENDDRCYFVNKYAILKSLDIFFNCKIIRNYLAGIQK